MESVEACYGVGFFGLPLLGQPLSGVVVETFTLPDFTQTMLPRTAQEITKACFYQQVTYFKFTRYGCQVSRWGATVTRGGRKDSTRTQSFKQKPPQ